MNTNKKKRTAGVTLVELMVVIGIFSTLLTIAIPNFLVWQANYRFKKAIRDVYSSFQLARLAAIKEHCLGTIVFHQPIDGVTYDYVVFAENLKDADGNSLKDADGNSFQNLEYDEGEKVLVKVKLSDYENVEFDSAYGSGDGITFFNNNDDLPAVAFRPGALTQTNSGGFGAGSVYLKDTKNNRTRRVVLSSGGRIRIGDDLN